MAHNQKKAAIGDVNSAIRFLQTAVERLEQGEEKILQSGEAPHQQLKAKIAAIVNHCDTVDNSGGEIDFESVVEQLRQLSAV